MPRHRFLAIGSALTWVGLVWGHAKVTSPPIRTPGQNFLQACGQTSFDSVSQDQTGHIEEQEPVPSGCVLTLCRGMLFSDQSTLNVQSVSPGQQMTMNVDCTIPHGGPANVSLVDTTVGGSGAVVGSFLKTFDDFCPTSGPTPADQTNLQFNLPDASTVGDKCQTAGDCVVQLFWATPDFSQNYYYCVDVAMSKAVASTSVGGLGTSTSASAVLPTTGPSTTLGSTGTAATSTNSALSSSQTSRTSGSRRNMRILWMDL